MPTTIATEQGGRAARLRRTAYVFLRSRIRDLLLAVWAITVLLICAHASFDGNSGNVVLGAVGVRADHDAQNRWLGKPFRKALRSAD